MKALKIVESNATEIESLLEQVNGRAVEHTYTSFSDVHRVSEHAERELLSLVGSKAAAVGSMVISVSGSSVPSSYRGVRRATKITLLRKTAGWYLIDACAEQIWNDAGKKVLQLSVEQDARAIAILRKRYTLETSGV